MKASQPYLFLLDVSWTLSSYPGHVQVRRWRRIDENAARRGFMRRKTAENILQLAAFGKTIDHAEPETYFILALYGIITPSAVVLKSQSTWDVLDGFLRLQPPVWTVQPRRQSSTSSHIQDTSRPSRLSRTLECPWNLYWMLLASYTIGYCRKVGETEQRGVS